MNHGSKVSIAALLLCLGWSADALSQVITISAGDRANENSIIVAPLPDSVGDETAFVLVDVQRQSEVAVQLTTDTPRQLVWQLDRPLEAGAARKFRLTVAPQSKPENHAVRVVNDNGAVRISVDGKQALVYNAATVDAPDGVDKVYNRSGYIHPIFTPKGHVVTDDFAPDHPHQHGLMYAWTNTVFDGRKIDFWNQKQRKGTVEHAEIMSLQSGPVFGEFVVRLRHLDLTDPEQPRAAIHESWRVRAFRSSKGFLFDLVSCQEAVTDPLEIKKYHYGGIAIRGNRHWSRKQGGQFLTSEGLDRSRGNHSRPDWCGIFGALDDGTEAGITMFCHPDNFRSPQPVRLHPTMPYFCYAPLVLGDFRIEPGAPYHSRYRFFVHDGRLDQAAGDQIWHDYACPPKVHVSE